jgi:hypothetical protein
MAQSIAVLQVSGDAPEPVLAEINEMLINAVQNNPSLQLAAESDLVLDEALMLLGCGGATTECMDQLADILEVERVLYAVPTDREGSIEVDLRYFDSVTDEYLLDERVRLDTPEDRTEFELRLAAAVSGRTVLRLLSERDGVRFSIDDLPPVDAPHVTFDLEPGRHLVTASCEGCEDLTRELVLREGRYYTETLTPPTAQVAVRPDGGGDGGGGGGGGKSIVLPVVTIATGVAMLGTGTIFGLLKNSTQDEFDTTPFISEAEDLADKGETQALLANIFLIGGAAVTVTGIVLFILNSGGDEPDSDAIQQASARPNAAPWLAPEGGGLLLEWRF